MEKNKKNYEKPQVSVEELTKALYEANKKLTKLENDRSEMFANISHDLRAPLAAIMGRLEYLIDNDDITKEERLISYNMMYSRGKNMDKLINDIFLMARLDNKAEQLHMEKVPLGFFLEDYFYMIVEETPFSKRQLSLEVPEGFDCIVNIDTNSFTRALDNLFTNALKYSKDNDSIILGVLEQKDSAIIFVKDTGIGMEEESVTKVFDRCFREDKARTPNGLASFGLGLSITKSIIEAHGGSIWCESQKGAGSTFFIKIPKQNG